MENRLALIEQRVAKLEDVKDDFFELRNKMTEMSMVDKNIYEKLEHMASTMKSHKDNFVLHDKNEMEKYSLIEKRLQKIERIIYMAMGAAVLLQVLNNFNLFRVG